MLDKFSDFTIHTLVEKTNQGNLVSLKLQESRPRHNR